MNPSDFTVNSPGHLVVIPEGGRAFVPDPLPQELTFSPETVTILTEASRSLGVLQGIGQSLPSPQLLVRPFLRREAELSSRIEGTYATQEELVLFEMDRAVEPAKPDVREVWNYIAALDHGLKRLKDLPVCLRMIRELHERLMLGVRGSEKQPGEFRKRQNWIGQHNQSIADARFVPPPISELQGCLDDFEKALHGESKLPILVRLALIHYQFEAIHPFLDGNGRVGRLLLPLLLAEKNILPQPLLHLSEFFEKNRNEYYDGLLHVSQNGSWQEWIQFFLQAVIAQAEETARRARRLLDLREEYRDKVQTLTSSALVLKLVDMLFITPGLNITSTSKRLHVTYPTAQAYVFELVKAGILVEVTGHRRNRVFLASRILDIVSRPSNAKKQ
jgi:cell filamentation protein, protein adenylyltransferase